MTAAAIGLGLFALVGVLLIATGWPAFVVLIFASIVGAAAGTGIGGLSLELLAALPNRVLNLLESDILQALPLYVVMGLLIDRLRIADALLRSFAGLDRTGVKGPVAAGLAVGALLGPMNGSVGASLIALARSIEPMLAAHGLPRTTRQAVLCVASTFGVVIPPSLVLILLGDAMMTAHTQALNVSQRAEFAVNTGDILRGALLPALAVIAASVATAVLLTRRGSAHVNAVPATRAGQREFVIAAASITGLLVLLAGVVSGRFRAVEAAALGACVLLAIGAASGALRGAALREVLRAAIVGSGTLFALLIGATTFTLVLRTLGTDRLVADWIQALPFGDTFAAVVVLAAIGVCAFVLDAFEIVFVVIPTVMPPLLVRVHDAQWIAVLALLTLQLSFVLPPIGYALTLSRALIPDPAPLRQLARALLPYLAVQIAVIGLVVAVPRLVHLIDARSLMRTEAPTPAARPGAAPSETDLDDTIRNFAPRSE